MHYARNEDRPPIAPFHGQSMLVRICRKRARRVEVYEGIAHFAFSPETFLSVNANVS